MKIIEIDIKDIKEYENNVKEHPDWQIEQIKNSILEFGFNDPIALDRDNNIIEGHGRFEALKQLNYKKVPCIYIDGDKSDIDAYRILHNKLNMMTGFDNKMLEQELDYLIENSVDIELLGFSDNVEIEDIEELELDLDSEEEEIYDFKYKCPCCEKLYYKEQLIEVKDE